MSNQKTNGQKNIYLISAIVLFSCIDFHNGFSQGNNSNIAVPMYSGGRFGDNLVAWSHALYFSMKIGCDLYFSPFKYSDQLLLDSLSKYTPAVRRRFKKVINFPGGKIIKASHNHHTLFFIPYFPESWIERDQHPWPSFEVDWDDEDFKQELLRLIYPKNSLHLIKVSENKISVAIHVRKGGSHLNEAELSCDPKRLLPGNLIYKIPLDDYYIDQLKKVSKQFNGTPLYVFIFTDHRDPQVLVEKYKKLVNISSIEFDCRKGSHDYYFNVLEDFFSMMCFDILIRPDSNFSIMAEKLGNHAMVISPGKFLPNSYVQEGIITIKNEQKIQNMQWETMSTK